MRLQPQNVYYYMLPQISPAGRPGLSLVVDTSVPALGPIRAKPKRLGFVVRMCILVVRPLGTCRRMVLKLSKDRYCILATIPLSIDHNLEGWTPQNSQKAHRYPAVSSCLPAVSSCIQLYPQSTYPSYSWIHWIHRAYLDWLRLL